MQRCFLVDVKAVMFWQHVSLPQPFINVYSVDYSLRVFRNKDDFCYNNNIVSEVIEIYYDPLLN